MWKSHDFRVQLVQEALQRTLICGATFKSFHTSPRVVMELLWTFNLIIILKEVRKQKRSCSSTVFLVRADTKGSALMLSHLKYLNGEQSETTVGVFHQWCLLAAHKTLS